MAIVGSKVFGPTSTTDDTVTTIGSEYKTPMSTGNLTITRMRLAYGEITATVEVSGHLFVIVPGVIGSPFCYAFGNSGGGAANDRTQTKAEIIDCRIPVPAGTGITIKALTAEEVAEVTVSCAFEPGLQSPEMTLEVGGTGQDPAADTALALTTNAKAVGIGVTNGLVPWRDGIIRSMRFSCGNLVDSKAASGYISLSIPAYPLPIEFAIGKGNGGDTSGTIGETDVITNLAIPVKKSDTITASVTMAEAGVSASLSLQCD